MFLGIVARFYKVLAPKLTMWCILGCRAAIATSAVLYVDTWVSYLLNINIILEPLVNNLSNAIDTITPLLLHDSYVTIEELHAHQNNLSQIRETALAINMQIKEYLVLIKQCSPESFQTEPIAEKVRLAAEVLPHAVSMADRLTVLIDAKCAQLTALQAQESLVNQLLTPSQSQSSVLLHGNNGLVLCFIVLVLSGAIAIVSVNG